VVGLFDDVNHTDMAMRDLRDKIGARYADISLVGNDPAGGHGWPVSGKDAIGDGAVAGASLGAVLDGIGG
jgi:hypothetical protein